MGEKFGPKALPIDMPHWRHMVERKLSRVTKEEAGTIEGGNDARDAYARRISRQLAARTFVQEYIASGFSLDAAYRALRPRATRRGVAKSAWRWLKDPYVVKLLSKYDRQRDRNAKLNLQMMLEEAIADAESSVMDFIKFDPETKAYRFDLNPKNYTPAQRRRLRGAKIFNGEIVEVKVPDALAARRQALEIDARLRGEKDETGPASVVTRNLGNRLKDVRAKQAEQLRQLARGGPQRTEVPQLPAAIAHTRASRIEAIRNSIVAEIDPTEGVRKNGSR